VCSDGGVSAIAAAVGPAVQAQSDMLRRQKEREEELRRKRDEEAKRVAELEAWEAEKRRKLKEERDRVQKMKQVCSSVIISSSDWLCVF
jgi:septal ring factor EnvC (AmiA/AmiB activator)